MWPLEYSVYSFGPGGIVLSAWIYFAILVMVSGEIVGVDSDRNLHKVGFSLSALAIINWSLCKATDQAAQQLF